MKFPILIKKDYTVFIEYREILDKESIFVHCDVYKWTKTIKRNLTKDLYFLFIIQELPIYVVTEPEDIKHRRFIYMMGFVPTLKQVTFLDGSSKELFIWNGTD